MGASEPRPVPKYILKNRHIILIHRAPNILLKRVCDEFRFVADQIHLHFMRKS